MQGDDLMADEVVSGLQARRDGVGRASVAGRHQRRGAPGAGRPRATLLLDLEPDRRRAGRPVLAACVGAAGHVGDDGADVAVWPEGPAESHGRPGGSWGVERSGSGANDTTVGVPVALEVDEGHVLDGAVSWDLAGDALRLFKFPLEDRPRTKAKIAWCELTGVDQ